MTMAPGYWRSASNPTQVLACVFKDKCLGGTESTCAQGYTGKFCTECAEDYYRVRLMECEQCGSAVAMWLELAAIALWLLAFMWAVLHFSLPHPDYYRLFVLKALVHHAQLLSILTSFKVTYPSSVHSLLKAFSYISSFRTTDLLASGMTEQSSSRQG